MSTCRGFKITLLASEELLLFSIQSSHYGATTVAKVSLFFTSTWSTLSFRLI